MNSHEEVLVKEFHRGIALLLSMGMSGSSRSDIYGVNRINSHPVATIISGEPLSRLLKAARPEETKPHYMTGYFCQSIARFVTLTSCEADRASRTRVLLCDALLSY